MNSIKESADGLALQVTKDARQAGLVQEDPDSNATGLSDVVVWSFDGLLLVISKSVLMGHRADLVSTAAGDTETIHAGYPASVAVAGNGYQVQLPGCEAAGFSVGDNAPVRSFDGVLFIHDGTEGRLIDDLIAIREEQTAN